VEQWRTIIDREYGERVVDLKNGIVTIKGSSVSSYTFKKDYFFMMGDNRDDSLDSRFWGLVARDMVVGQAFITLFSWDRDIPFSQLFKLIGSIRLDRVLLLLH
ncbi:MAG: S26 family signal peptidase, partial [Ignavibacteriaceae bacterium]|nr:S26 family signal peptidase [Ignavibacteriaceae bacterium]